ncbi:MAG: PAS domain S-box protein [Bacteroidota bacterium]
MEITSKSVSNYLIDINVLPTPSLILEGLVVLGFNPALNNLLKEDNKIEVGKSIVEQKLFKETQSLKEFLAILEQKSEIEDYPLYLWNGTPIFVTARTFQADGSTLTLLTLTRFALSENLPIEFVFGNVKYFKNVLDKFDFWITIKDRNSKIVLCNQSFENFIGLPTTQILGKDLESLFGPNEFVRLQKETDEELFSGKKDQIHFHAQISDKEGKIHYLEVTKFLINFGGEKYVFCISIDTSELDYIRQLYEESSTLYRALIENAFDAIYLMKGRRYQYVNPRFCELTGYTFEELTSPDFDFEVLVSDESKRYLEERYRARLEGKEIPNQYELQLVHKSGKKVYVEVSTVSVGKPGEVVVMGIMRDITQRKQYEQQLKESEERLKELNFAKDKFFNIIAHDLRAPISGLISMTKMLIENSEILSPDGMRELLVDLLEFANQSYNLLENLLQWARTQTGTIPFNPEDTDLFEIALASKLLNEPNAKQKNIVISNNVPPQSFSFVDRNMITTIVRNLVSNAIKFTNPGGEIRINLIDKGDNFELSVSDTGVGMSKEQMDKLFKVGENVSTLGTSGEKGSGFGLILCKEFVEKNGGTIRVESELGKGTTFYVTLPKAKAFPNQ